MEGVPFLAPWGNRLSEPAFWANGKKYQFNLGAGQRVGERAADPWIAVDVAFVEGHRRGARMRTRRMSPAAWNSGNIPT